ncbi:hypothetical protein [Longimicrobium sp.]|uniref:hypothetical protein n=1 Tax=Longimicrobium sp. TaxID=2029185 RepID=UPI002E3660AC|nr:hypothetical protein [Longimicrobium sp.]HEX6038797.1 hypothetical protein [Longimicrobium sp.]
MRASWLLALLLAIAAPAAAQVPDTLSSADRAAIVARVLQARRAELHDRVEVDTASLTRVLGTPPGRVPALAPLPPAPRDADGRWAITEVELQPDGDVLVRADRLESGGSARRETYRLRRTCAAGGACGWWLVDIRLHDFESNDVVPPKD